MTCFNSLLVIDIHQIAFEVLVKVLMSVCPGEDLDSLKREFEEFIKGLICLPIKLPGTRLYKSLKVYMYMYICKQIYKYAKQKKIVYLFNLHVIRTMYSEH